MTFPDDAELLAGAAAGRERDFNALVDRHQQPLRAFLRRLGHSHEEADDLAQETFVTAWTGAQSFRGGSTVRTWLFGIAWRKSKSAKRSWFRMRARDEAWEARNALEAPIAASSEDAMAVRDALKGLSLEQRAAVALCLAGDFSHADAAESLGLPLGTVKSHVNRGRARLQQVLGDRR